MNCARSPFCAVYLACSSKTPSSHILDSSDIQINHKTFGSEASILGEEDLRQLLTLENCQKKQALDIVARLLLLAKAGKSKDVPIREKEVEVEVEVEEKVRCPGHSTRKTTNQQAESSDAHAVRFARFSICVHTNFMLLAITFLPLHGLEQLIAILLKW
jgi:hypothetical protein